MKFVCTAILFSVMFYFPGCHTKQSVNTGSSRPKTFLWAWERKEDLRFLKDDSIGVAYYAQTLVIEKVGVRVLPRRNQLYVNPNTYLIAVTRIESAPDYRFSDSEVDSVSSSILKTLKFKNIKEIQIDFDAVVAERLAYRKLIEKVRQNLPSDSVLTITALASWCSFDKWFGLMPVNEAIPMLFDMGTDKAKIEQYLSEGKDWNEEACKKSYGLSIDQKLQTTLRRGRTTYYFSSKRWRASDLERINYEE